MLRPVHLDVNDGAAHPGERQRSLDAAREDLVRVDCLPKRLDDAGSGGVLLRLRDSSRELAGEEVDLFSHLGQPTLQDDLGGLAGADSDHDDNRRDDERERRENESDHEEAT